MPIEQIVALLVAERNRLDAAIRALQGPAKRRGLPPGRKGPAPAVPVAAPVARKRKISAAGRKAIADASRKRWAAIKAGKTASAPVERKRKLSAAARKAMAAAAKKRWAAIKAGKARNPFAKKPSKKAG
jgi:hypothetical protein